MLQGNGRNAVNVAYGAARAFNGWVVAFRIPNSGLRERYELARHYRDEIVPLRQAMADENVLRYNGMLIGVFELLAEARDQISSVSNAINAQQQFWLADAALSASVMGKPTATGGSMAGGGGEASAAAAH